MALTWPASLVPRSASFRIDARSQTGGPTITGDEQIVQSAAGIWRARLSAITVNTRERILAYRALLAGLDGRFGTVFVPLCDKSRAPLTATTYSLIGTAVANPDWQRFLADTVDEHIGDVVANPDWQRFFPDTVDDHIGDAVANPAWWKRWDAVIDNETYRYTEIGHLGTATIVSHHSFEWAPDSGTPAVGDHVELFDLLRRVTQIEGSRHVFEPSIQPTTTPGAGLTPIGHLGTATIVSHHTLDWAPDSGTPEINDEVILAGLPYRISRIEGSRHVFEPSIQPTTTPGAGLIPIGHLGLATIVSERSFDWVPDTGVPEVGDLVNLDGADRRIIDIEGTRHVFDPPISAVATPGTAATTANAAAATQATTIVINLATGSPIEPGMYFSTPTGRLHLITAVIAADPIYTCTIRPPLRAALAAGAVLEMVNPVCEMRLASDDTGELELQMLKQGQATLDFVEA